MEAIHEVLQRKLDTLKPGLRIEPPDKYDDFPEDIGKHGSEYGRPVENKIFVPNECHNNALYLYLKYGHEGCKLITGYALGWYNDGEQYWYRHSWIVNKNGKTIETFYNQYEKYFGIEVVDTDRFKRFILKEKSTYLQKAKGNKF